ncbi:efflux RND transporter periplasmic adaptor subunit [Photobacterium sanguinicancri]|uniref:efflux RND transporter periplasmic adaptor subunit n=1 Tax=Photobacterium sanguinicancri TaxID=875932 RepID=UPI0021C28A27|nr:efflux RND transporter periplasmic adaptor subunit [Photobacterium sanguinicancri]
MNKYLKDLGVITLFIISPFAMSEDYAMGSLVPVRSVTVSSEVTGIVDEFDKGVGDSIAAGEVLVKLSIADNALNIKLAKAELDVSLHELTTQEKQLQRFSSLYETKGISASDYDEQHRKTRLSRAQVEVDKIKLAMVQREKEKSEVKAPFSGLILKRNIELGQFIPSGEKLYTLVDMSKVKVEFYLLESDVMSTHKGDVVNVIIPALNNKSVQGYVDILSPAFEAGDPGFLVEVIVDNTGSKLKPGMQARVKLAEQGE